MPANIDARLTDNSEDTLVASLKSLTLRDTDLPTRPGFGTSGAPVKLRTNFFPVRVPKGPLYEYDVAITPATAIKRIKRRIFQLAEQTADWANAGMLGRVAHDHSTKLISSFTLPQPLVVKVIYTDEDEDEDKKREKEYALTIKYIQDIETQSLVKCVSHPLASRHTRVCHISRCWCTRPPSSTPGASGSGLPLGPPFPCSFYRYAC